MYGDCSEQYSGAATAPGSIGPREPYTLAIVEILDTVASQLYRIKCDGESGSKPSSVPGSDLKKVLITDHSRRWQAQGGDLGTRPAAAMSGNCNGGESPAQCRGLSRRSISPRGRPTYDISLNSEADTDDHDREPGLAVPCSAAEPSACQSRVLVSPPASLCRGRGISPAERVQVAECGPGSRQSGGDIVGPPTDNFGPTDEVAPDPTTAPMISPAEHALAQPPGKKDRLDSSSSEDEMRASKRKRFARVDRTKQRGDRSSETRSSVSEPKLEATRSPVSIDGRNVPCPMCNELFPVDDITAHANLCVEARTPVVTRMAHRIGREGHAGRQSRLDEYQNARGPARPGKIEVAAETKASIATTVVKLPSPREQSHVPNANCPFCDKSFPQDLLERHVNVAHLEGDDSESGSETTLSQQQRRVQPRRTVPRNSADFTASEPASRRRDEWGVNSARKRRRTAGTTSPIIASRIQQPLQVRSNDSQILPSRLASTRKKPKDAGGAQSESTDDDWETPVSEVISRRSTKSGRKALPTTSHIDQSLHESRCIAVTRTMNDDVQFLDSPARNENGNLCSQRRPRAMRLDDVEFIDASDGGEAQSSGPSFGARRRDQSETYEDDVEEFDSDEEEAGASVSWGLSPRAAFLFSFLLPK